MGINRVKKKKKTYKRALKVVSNPIFGNEEHRPSSLQMRFAEIYLRRLDLGDELGRGFEINILENDLKCTSQNWYNWNRDPRFVKWFLALKENFNVTRGLSNVHTATYSHALKESPADRKLFLERFDKMYKPQTAQSVSFVGMRPADNINEDSVKTQSEEFRKRIESKAV